MFVNASTIQEKFLVFRQHFKMFFFKDGKSSNVFFRPGLSAREYQSLTE